MAKGRGGVEMVGGPETLAAIRQVSKQLGPEENSALRKAAGEAAAPLAAALVRAAETSGVPVAPRVARSIAVKRDRIPVVAIGGSRKVGTGKRGQAGALLWGSEQGAKSDPDHFAVAPNSAGYWIAPTVARFADGPAIARFQRAVYETLHGAGLV
jgi:hypothetical protein